MLALTRRARKHGVREAIISDAQTFLYNELLEASEELAHSILGSQHDLSEAPIAFMVRPGFDYVKTQWAIWQAGGIAVPLCDFHPLPSIQYVLEDTGARQLIVSPEFAVRLSALAIDLGIKLIVLGEEQEPADRIPLPEISSGRKAMILYTSGTTNLPKGVVTSHRNIESQVLTLVKAWEWQAGDHILCVLPLHHVHGIVNVTLCALWSGATVEFLPGFDARKVFECFSEGAINLFMAVPTIYYKLIDYFQDQSDEWRAAMTGTLMRFRLMVSGSAALPISVLTNWQSISGQTLLERYGMTEIGMAVSNPYSGERRPGHIGQPLPGVLLRIIDESGEEVAEDEPGEIQVKGPNVFVKYWNKPQATLEAFTDDGWFKTGDVAVWNRGSIRILGRNSVDIIKSGGYKISALEIEEVLRTHPKIKDCGVVGVPDDEWGELICASLVLESEAIDLDKLKTWMQERMPSYRLPRRFIFQSDLPRNTLGKVTKKEIIKDFTKA